MAEEVCVMESLWIVLSLRVSFWEPKIVRQPYKKDPKRDPNLEYYPYMF